MSEPIVECEGLVHIYRTAELEVVALQGLDLRVEPGEVVAIVGRSGSGKTTLMNVIAGVEEPTAGVARVGGHDLVRMSERERETYRRELVGYVLQHSQANLATDLNALENVLLPMTNRSTEESRQRAAFLLETMGIDELATSFPGELSGGEAERLAVAIAMANQPQVLLADEPTAELDRATADSVLRDLRQLLRESGSAAIIVTHDASVERHADRVIQIRDGRTSTQTRWREQAGEVVSDELLIMDRAGRIQLPRAYVERLGARGLIRAHLEGEEIRLRRGDQESPSE
jgi:ABC-type lipoprotein export system ATPase subunit